MNIRANAMTHNTPFLFFLLGVFLSSGSYTENDSANPDAEPVPVTSETDAVETAPATVPPPPSGSPSLSARQEQPAPSDGQAGVRTVAWKKTWRIWVMHWTGRAAVADNSTH